METLAALRPCFHHGFIYSGLQENTGTPTWWSNFWRMYTFYTPKASSKCSWYYLRVISPLDLHFRHAVRYNIMVNPTGKEGAWRGADWVEESNNLFAKVRELWCANANGSLQPSAWLRWSRIQLYESKGHWRITFGRNLSKQSPQYWAQLQYYRSDTAPWPAEPVKDLRDIGLVLQNSWT